MYSLKLTILDKIYIYLNKTFLNYLKLVGQLSGKSKQFCFLLRVSIEGCGICSDELLGTIGVKEHEEFVTSDGFKVGRGGCNIGTGGTKFMF